MILPYKDGEVFYSSIGKGPNLVLLHGFLETSAMWTAIANEFSKDYTVTTIDLLGHGKTSTFGAVHTMEQMADAVAHVLTHLGITQCSLIGHSMGGYVSLALLEMAAELVSCLVLMNSTAEADSPERYANRNRAIKAVKANKSIFVRMAVTNLFSEENRLRLSAEVEQVKLIAQTTSTSGIIAALEGMKTRKDRRDLFASSTIPKLIIAGKKDSVLDFEGLLEQAESPSVKLVIFPDGHMSHLENYEDLILELKDFIRAKTG